MRERRLAAFVAAILALAPLPAFADAVPPPGMLPNAANAQLPTARGNLGDGAGNGVNVVTDYGADPTGTNDSTTAFQNAVNAACNTPAAGNSTHQVFVPSGYYLISATISITGTAGCWIEGQGEQFIAPDDGGTYILAAGSFTTGDLFQFRGLGQFRLSNMRLDVTNQFTGGASYARIHAAGTGYAAGDTITLTGGTFTTATVIKVTAVSAGAITGSVIITPGVYSVAPSPVAPVAQGSTSGSGSGASFDVVYANSAAISLSGPMATLSANAAAGAGSITVSGISAGFNNPGFAISVELDSGAYYSTTVASVTGNTIALTGTLPSAAAAGHPVYLAGAERPIIENVICADYWDCLRIDNASYVVVRDFVAVSYSHDGIIKTSGAHPDGGNDRLQFSAWDFSVGTSNAGLEVLAGGPIDVSGSNFQASNYSVLLNSYFGPTGTLQLRGGSYEGALICTVRLHQSVSGTAYGNVSVSGIEFASSTVGQHFCVDEGTPPAGGAKWISNIVFSENHSNDFVSAAGSLINVQDGDNVVIEGNALNNNATAGPTGISVGGNATHVVEAGNEIANFSSGQYGTMQAGSLDGWRSSGAVLSKVPSAVKTANYTILGTDSGTYFDNTGATGEVDFTLPAWAAGLRYCFTVTAAQTVKVIAPAASHIAVGTSNSAAAGNITASAVYANACLHATGVSNQWSADATTGTWTVN